MVSVTHIVEKQLNSKPFLQEALAKGIINYAALAEQLEPEVRQELRKPVTHAAVMMAIRRYAEKLEKTFVRQSFFDQNADLTAKSDLVEITVHRSAAVEQKFKQLYDLVDFRSGDFLTITHGIHELTIITNRKYRDAVAKLFSKEEIRIIIDKLSSLTVRIPSEAIETMGMFYLCTRALNWENINVIEIVSTYTELTFIVRDADVTAAYTALQKLIQEQR